MEEQNAILSQMANQQDDSYDDYETSAPTAAHLVEQRAEPSLTEQLTDIEVLLNKGVITADEHAALRKKVLGL